jgi:hypothetical protein
MKDINYYSSQQNDEEFKKDLFEHFGVQNHPKRETCYHLAYEIGHAHGYSEVLYHFTDLVELIKPSKKTNVTLSDGKKQELWNLAKRFGFYEAEVHDEFNGKTYKEISIKSENFWLFIETILSES